MYYSDQKIKIVMVISGISKGYYNISTTAKDTLNLAIMLLFAEQRQAGMVNRCLLVYISTWLKYTMLIVFQS